MSLGVSYRTRVGREAKPCPISRISSVLSLSLRHGPLSIKCWSRWIKTAEQHLLWGARTKNKNRSQLLQLIVNSKPLLFSRWKSCCTLSVYSTSNWDWGYFSRLRKKPFRHLCSLCVTSTNEHIIIRQAREQGYPADLWWCQSSDVLLMLLITFNIHVMNVGNF